MVTEDGSLAQHITYIYKLANSVLKQLLLYLVCIIFGVIPCIGLQNDT